MKNVDKSKKLAKALLMFACLIFTLQLSVAQGFGSFPVQESKKIDDLDATFRIGLINLDNYTKKIVFDTGVSESYSAELGENPMFLEPSNVSSDPGSGNWYSLGGGEYAEIQYAELRVELDEEEAERKKFSIPVQVAAESSAPENSGAVQRAFMVQTHEFILETTSQRIRPRADNLYSDGGLIGFEENRTSEDEKSSREEAPEINRSSGDVGETEETGPEKGLTQEKKDEDRAGNS
jgi:hypothetical protein